MFVLGLGASPDPPEKVLPGPGHPEQIPDRPKIGQKQLQHMSKGPVRVSDNRSCSTILSVGQPSLRMRFCGCFFSGEPGGIVRTSAAYDSTHPQLFV